MNQKNYGQIVDGYAKYSANQELAEWRLGRRPFLDELGCIEGKLIVDFGCGPANFSSIFTKGGAKVIGFDADKETIAAAKMADPDGDYWVYRGLLANELAGKEIDVVTATFSICTVPDRELRYILRDMRQLLSNGGKLYILEPNQLGTGIEYADLHYHYKENAQTGDLVNVTLGSGENKVDIPPDVYRTHHDYRTLLGEAGFTIDKMEEPMPDPTWEGDWTKEVQYPPFLLIVAH